MTGPKMPTTIDSLHSLGSFTTLIDLNTTHDVSTDTRMHNYFLKVDDWVLIVCALLATVTMVIGVPSNIILILAVCVTRSLRTSINALVINLLLADLVGSFVCCPLIIVITSSVPPSYVCHIFDFTQILYGTVQLITIALLSFERYQAIKNPFDQQYRNLRIHIGISFSWVFGAVICLVSLYMRSNPFLHLCSHDYDEYYNRYDFGLYIFIPVSFLAITAIIICYMRIMYHISDHIAKRKRQIVWKRKVNKVTPMVSVSVALVNTSSTQTLNETQNLIEPPMLRGPSGSLINFPSTSKTLPPVPFNHQIRHPPSGSTSNQTVIRKTKSDSTLPSIADTLDANELKPKYSHDSKLKHMVELPLAVHAFLNPTSERSSLYHSDGNISRCEPSPKSLRNKMNSEPVTFTALERLHRESIEREQDIEQKSRTASPNYDIVQNTLNRLLNPDFKPHNYPSSTRNSLQVNLSNDGFHTRNEEIFGTRDLAKKQRASSAVDVIRIHDFEGNTKNANVTSSGIMGDVCVMNRQTKEQAKRRLEQRTAKRTAAIIITFLACWTPLLMSILASLVLDSGSNYMVRVWCEAYLFTQTLSLVAAVMNPIIYGIINNKFRSALVKMINRFRNKWVNRMHSCRCYY